MLDTREERHTVRYILDNLREKYDHPDNIIVRQSKNKFLIKTVIENSPHVDILEKKRHTFIKPCEVLCNFKSVCVPIKFM